MQATFERTLGCKDPGMYDITKNSKKCLNGLSVM